MGSRLRARNRLLARIISFCVGTFLLAMPMAARAANNCPWMNEASASDLVGGDVVGAYVADQGKPAVCTFTQHDSKTTRTLQISVEIANDPHNRFLSTLKEQ